MPSRPATQRAIDQEITSFFTVHAIRASVIYRTCQDKFRGEYPHNFVNKDKRANSLRVAIEYENKRITLDSIRRIIACPGHLLDSLPRQQHVRLDGGKDKPDKVDFGQLDTRFVFRNWAELQAQWRRLWE